jgi:hypothetical protein
MERSTGRRHRINYKIKEGGVRSVEAEQKLTAKPADSVLIKTGVQPTINKYDALCADTQHFFGVVAQAVESMPKAQKFSTGGLGVFMLRHIHTALMHAERIRDYAGIGQREKLLREYTLSLRLLRDIAVIAHQRNYFQKDTTANSLTRVAVHLANTATNYARWLQHHPGQGAK